MLARNALCILAFRLMYVLPLKIAYKRLFNFALALLLLATSIVYALASIEEAIALIVLLLRTLLNITDLVDLSLVSNLYLRKVYAKCYKVTNIGQRKKGRFTKEST